MSDKKKKQKKKESGYPAGKRSLEIIAMRDDESDPLGSYTGLPEEYGEVPVQDADDL